MTRGKGFRPTLFAAPLALFLLSALVGAWIGHGQLSDGILLGLIVLSVGAYGAVVCVPEQVTLPGGRRLAPLGILFGSLPTILSLYFLLTNDWGRWIGKLPWLDPLMRWFSSWTFATGHALNPNIAGGLIAVFLPLQLAALKDDGPRGGWGWVSAVMVAVSFAGLLLSASRGAWVALALVAGTWGLWKLGAWLAQRFAAGRYRLAFQGGLLLAAALGITVFVSTRWGGRLWAFIEADRAVIWRNSFDLARDYFFTGQGFGQFEMAYSSYVMLLHVGQIPHAHNLFLDIWLQQGLLGLVALGGMLAFAAWARPAPWRAAALASVGVIVLHGLMDDAFYALGGYTAVLIFLPFAVLARPALAPPAATGLTARRRYWQAGLAGGLVLASLGAALFPGVQAVFWANWGALTQTRLELALFHWPEWPIQDALRRSPAVNLAPVIQAYQRALALDAQNVTANRRLGQIELSLGQYEAACGHLEAAYQVAPGERATRQLLGECYAVTGKPEQAAELWRTVDVSQGQLMLRQWWHDYLGDRQRLAWLQQAIALTQ